MQRAPGWGSRADSIDEIQALVLQGSAAWREDSREPIMLSVPGMQGQSHFRA